jgi:capsular polysaccharide export protein
MKIICLGYYDDFARFFLSVKKEFKKRDKEVDFKYLSIYFSGFLYFLFRMQNVSFFSFRVWIDQSFNRLKYIDIADNREFYKGVNLDDVIQYHVFLNGVKKKKLKIQAISYINIIEKELKKFKPNVLILSGDSRMSIEIFSIKAREFNIKIYYFEQGPFGTTILDRSGVNANCSIRSKKIDFNRPINEVKLRVDSFFSRNKEERYKRNPFYRGSDYFLQAVLSPFGMLPPDIHMDISYKYEANIAGNIITGRSQFNNIFLLILQVPFDANMVYHSPYFDSHSDIVKCVYFNLPHDSQLLVREHPLYKGKYEKELYEFMYQNNILLDDDNLKDSINKSDVVVVNNSTVGIEAIANMKTVVVLGDCYYDNPQICLKLERKEDLNILLKDAVENKVDVKKVWCYLDVLLNVYLVDGHFRDENLKSPFNIANQITEDFLIEAKG